MTLSDFKSAVSQALRGLREAAADALGDGYDVTVIIHRGKGDPSDSVVASTGEKQYALAPLTESITDSNKMDRV
jgi:hypothetical protein